MSTTKYLAWQHFYPTQRPVCKGLSNYGAAGLCVCYRFLPNDLQLGTELSRINTEHFTKKVRYLFPALVRDI